MRKLEFLTIKWIKVKYLLITVNDVGRYGSKILVLSMDHVFFLYCICISTIFRNPFSLHAWNLRKLTKHAEISLPGLWSGETPHCQPVRCTALEILDAHLRVLSLNNSFQGEASFLCPFGYALVGPETIQCGADGKWTG